MHVTNVDLVKRLLLAAQTPPSVSLERSPADTSWRVHLAFLPAGSDIWIASNSEYRTAENREPVAYGQRYWLGIGRTTVQGCLWGEYGEERPVFWKFFTAWDPSREQMLVHQEAPGGTFGIGYESIESGIAEQTFTQPNGAVSVTRHVSRRAAPDTLITESFDQVGGEWQARRTYTWIRQPAGVAAGC
jgi:hypothetical protein